MKPADLREVQIPDPPSWADATDDPERARILNAIADDARRSLQGQPAVCARCTKEIDQPRFLYRCAECTLPFHRSCILAHFAEHGLAADQRLALIEAAKEQLRRQGRAEINDPALRKALVWLERQDG